MLNIPIVAIIDSNSNPEDINYPIPGNDDATRAINTFCELISQSIKSGLNAYSQSPAKNNDDPGNSDEIGEDQNKLDDIERKLEENTVNKSHSNHSGNQENIAEKKDELDLG